MQDTAGADRSNPVEVARFRSTFQGERGILTAELMPRPTPRWRELCERGLESYRLGFASEPQLVADSIVVPVAPRDLATSEDALRTVVRITNRLEAAIGTGVGAESMS